MSYEIVFDAENPYLLAHFWAAAMNEYEVRTYDAEEIARLANLGLTPETDTSVPIDAAGKPTIWFQQSDEATAARNRIHLDLKYGSRRTESLRLGALGAIVKQTREDHIVMLDPEGNQFCLYDS